MRTCSVNGCMKPYFCSGFCQMHRWRMRHYGNPLRERNPRPVCSVEGCHSVVKGYALCQLHLLRRKRGLPMDYAKPTLQKKRYRIIRDPSHPLSDRRGRVYEHRAVLFNIVEGRRVPCFWCGKPLEWLTNLFVDHLNHDRHDNRSTNLVPSCNGCNAGRTRNNPRVRKSVYSCGAHFPVREFVWEGTEEVVGS